jgi:hypothetical protein
MNHQREDKVDLTMVEMTGVEPASRGCQSRCFTVKLHPRFMSGPILNIQKNPSVRKSFCDNRDNVV